MVLSPVASSWEAVSAYFVSTRRKHNSLHAVTIRLAAVVLLVVLPSNLFSQDNYSGVVINSQIPDSYIPPVVQAQPQVDLEKAYLVKSVYLLRFTRFISWPNFADSKEFRFGVLGESPVLALLEKGKSKVKVVTDKLSGEKLPMLVSQYSEVKDLEECHILFIGESVSEADSLAAIERYKGTQTLVVGETTAFVESGGTIGLVIVGQSVNFVVNVSAAKEQGLTCSAQMLKAAYRIVDNSLTETSESVSKTRLDQPAVPSVP